MLERGGIEIVNLICDHRDVPSCVEKGESVELNGKRVQDASQLGKKSAEKEEKRLSEDKETGAKTA